MERLFRFPVNKAVAIGTEAQAKPGSGHRLVHRVVEDTEVIDSRLGFIQVGGNMTVTGDLVNDKSYLDVSGTFSVKGSFNNMMSMEPTIIADNGSFRWTEIGWNWSGTSHVRKYKSRKPYNPAPVSIFNERGIVLDASNPFTMAEPGQMDLAYPNGNLYGINPLPTSDYLIESNPNLTSYRQWLGADFMLYRLNSNLDVAHKRLGDVFYEQRMVREQIAKLTGLSRLGSLGNYPSDEKQLLVLMTAGLEFAEEFKRNRRAPVCRSGARLTSDTVWLEYVTVDTANAPVQVLAPKVYLRPGTESLITAEGGLVAARNVVMELSGKFENSGNLLGTNVLNVRADIINNVKGSIAGGLISRAAVFLYRTSRYYNAGTTCMILIITALSVEGIVI